MGLRTALCPGNVFPPVSPSLLEPVFKTTSSEQDARQALPQTLDGAVPPRYSGNSNYPFLKKCSVVRSSPSQRSGVGRGGLFIAVFTTGIKRHQEIAPGCAANRTLSGCVGGRQFPDPKLETQQSFAELKITLGTSNLCNFCSAQKGRKEKTFPPFGGSGRERHIREALL